MVFVVSTSETRRILYVEDIPETQFLVEQLIDTDDLVCASNADEALRAIESESFDLLLLDINLGPGKSGTKLLHTVRERKDGEKIPAIALTAYAMPGDREELLEKGFDGYVSKPFTRAELTEAIEEVLTVRMVTADGASPDRR